jgi:hypothetical protein
MIRATDSIIPINPVKQISETDFEVYEAICEFFDLRGRSPSPGEIIVRTSVLGMDQLCGCLDRLNAVGLVKSRGHASHPDTMRSVKILSVHPDRETAVIVAG